MGKGESRRAGADPLFADGLTQSQKPGLAPLCHTPGADLGQLDLWAPALPSTHSHPNILPPMETLAAGMLGHAARS